MIAMISEAIHGASLGGAGGGGKIIFFYIIFFL